LGRHISCRSLKSQKVPWPRPRPLSCRWMSGIRIHGALPAPPSSTCLAGPSLLRVLARRIPLTATRLRHLVVVATLFMHCDLDMIYAPFPSFFFCFLGGVTVEASSNGVSQRKFKLTDPMQMSYLLLCRTWVYVSPLVSESDGNQAWSKHVARPRIIIDR
jgi:hypothetical protein